MLFSLNSEQFIYLSTNFVDLRAVRYFPGDSLITTDSADFRERGYFSSSSLKTNFLVFSALRHVRSLAAPKSRALLARQGQARLLQ